MVTPFLTHYTHYRRRGKNHSGKMQMNRAACRLCVRMPVHTHYSYFLPAANDDDYDDGGDALSVTFVQHVICGQHARARSTA